MRLTLLIACLVFAGVSARSCNSRNTCKNSGTCVPVFTRNEETEEVKESFKCVCAAGYTGKRCELVVTPQNWVRHGSCQYLAVEAPILTYGKASYACKRHGAYLANIMDDAEDAVVASLFDKASAGRWIGLKQKKAGQEFYSDSDNSVLDQGNDYSAWFAGEPGASGERCVIQDTRDGVVGWSTAKCQKERKYVCKKCDTDVAAKKRRRRRRRTQD
jgi:hypothetical protein